MIGGAIVIGCFICVRVMIRRCLVLMDVLVCGVSVMNIRCVIVVARWIDVMRLGISAGVRLVRIGERTCAADAQMRAKARLQLAESRDAWIRFLPRHAPTWRPLGRPVPLTLAVVSRFVNRSGRRSSPLKTIDPPALYRVSFQPRSILQKDIGKRDERKAHDHPTRSRIQGPRLSSCRAMAAAPCRSPISRAASSVVYFYPRADTPGCTRESIDFSKLNAAIREGRHGRPRGVRRSGRGPGQVQDQARSDRPAALRRDPQDAGGLWRLGQEIHVRQDFHGNRPDDRADRPGRPDRPASGQRSRSTVTPPRCSRPPRPCEWHRPCRRPVPPLRISPR